MSDLTGAARGVHARCYPYEDPDEPSGRPVSALSPPHVSVSRGSRILIAEDQAVVAMEIEDRLGRLGYDVVGIASTAEQAVTMALEREPDLLLFDIRLEGNGDGVEAAEAVLKERSVPVVFLSAYADEQTMRRVRPIEPAAYLLKPFDEQMLQITLDTALYKHRVALERCREERERRAVEARLAAVLNHSPDAIVGMGEDHRVEVFNRGAERTFGYEFAEACGMFFEELFEDRGDRTVDSLFEELERLAEVEDSPVVRGEVLGRRRTGGCFPAEISLSQVELAGRVLVTAIVRDVTERNRLQEKFLKAQKLEAVGRLAAGVAHDFNNLLSAIQCNAFLAGAAVDKPDELRTAVRAINGSVRRGASLTRQLLGFAKRVPGRPRVLDLGEVMASLEQLLQVLAGAETEIVMDIEVGTGVVEIDPSRFEQAVMNLVVNARDAMARGGRLTFSIASHHLAQERRVRSVSLPPGEYVRFSVADDGVGMEPELLDRIFEPFFTTKGSRRGTGLGLSTVLDVVTERDGAVDVESTPGVGTTFHLYLPRARAVPEEIPADRMTPAPLSLDVSVLVVDDDEVLRRAIEHVLSGAGCRVSSASSGEAAIRLCREGSGFDLALVDIVMPRLNGRTLAESLRAIDPNLRILHMSGHPDEGQGAMIDEPSPMLHKPFSIDSLMCALAELAREELPR